MAAVVLVGGVVMGGPPVDAQVPAPVLTMSPTDPQPGDRVVFTLTGCTEDPAGPGVTYTGSYAHDDTFYGPEPFIAQPDGSTSVDFGLDEEDFTLRTVEGCAEGEVSGVPAVADVFAPHIHPLPILSPEVTAVELTDCGDAAAPSGPPGVFVDVASDPAYDPDDLDISAFDAEGDVLVTFTAPLPPGPVTISAHCGSTQGDLTSDIVYEPVSFVVEGEVTTSTTSTVPVTSAPPPTTAAPATPVATDARFTG